jgi:hypothetical protein
MEVALGWQRFFAGFIASRVLGVNRAPILI